MAGPALSRRYFLLLSFLVFLSLAALSIKINRLTKSRSPHHHDLHVPEPPPKPNPNPKPIIEIFPDATNGNIPEISELNKPPQEHHPTPLFIGFTRNWPMLQQAVVSYITAGWPPCDIYVVDNSGTMDSNELGLLTLQNPFFVDYTRLKLLGVNILTTPTLFTFAQLQNFFLFTSIERKWGHYYWSHMDSVALSWEDRIPYKSLYQNIVEKWSSMDRSERWGVRFFQYDHLTLVNVAAYKEVGGWDTHIPFYTGDCDMHSRLLMRNWTIVEERVGHVFDVAGTVGDLREFFPRGGNETVGGERYCGLWRELERLQGEKGGNEGGRNYWQRAQMGGKGEPFYVDPKGFEKAIEMWITFGRQVFAEKWGHAGCDILDIRTYDDPWNVEPEHD
ncbi:hypothetical protein RUND412_006383 [Rhizina undulata]